MFEDFVVRLLLEYGGEGYENRVMRMSKPDWLAYKTSLGFDFPNLPYYQVNILLSCLLLLATDEIIFKLKFQINLLSLFKGGKGSQSKLSKTFVMKIFLYLVIFISIYFKYTRLIEEYRNIKK